jgi:diaminopimelate decarboxylase
MGMISAPMQDTRFRLGSAQAEELAQTFGTPLYVVDESHFRDRIRTYLRSAKQSTLRSEISFASKANSTLALIKIAYEEGCTIDVASEGELRAAMAASVPASACHLHGNNKTQEELQFAIENRIGHIVADHFGELDTISQIISDQRAESPKIVLRLAPGVDPVTHLKISTGQSDTKFGFNIKDGSAEAATKKCLELGLRLIGYHCHVGSQLLDPEAQRSGGELLAQFAVEMANRFGFHATYINVGGGLGVHYTESDHPIGIETYCELVNETVRKALSGSPLSHVTIGHEPGRSLVAESGVTLYRVGVIKTVPAKERLERTYVAVDGGLSDNPRPVMDGSKYTVLSLGAESSATRTVTVSGKHCETDKLFEDVELPQSLKAGDLIQVLCTGAYNSSMSSNYNRYPRPATALIRADGRLQLIQRRDDWSEMFARDTIPPDL